MHIFLDYQFFVSVRINGVFTVLSKAIVGISALVINSSDVLKPVELKSLTISKGVKYSISFVTVLVSLSIKSFN